MLLFAKISRFPLFENSGFLVETGSFPDGRGVGNTLRPLQPVSRHVSPPRGEPGYVSPRGHVSPAV